MVGRIVCVLGVAAFAAGWGQVARAAEACTYDAGARRVTLLLAPGTSTALMRDGVHIATTSGDCGDATIHNTDLITVVGSDQTDELLLLEAGGAFPRRIHFALDLGTDDYLSMYRGSTDDRITFGQDGIARDGDGTADVVFLGDKPIVRLDSGGGRDRVSGQGGHGTGAPAQYPLNLTVGGGDDMLVGGDGPDHLTVNGYPAATGPVPPRLDGAGGDDYLSFAPTIAGLDVRGGPGSDFLSTGGPVPLSISLDDVADDGNSGSLDNVHSDVEDVTAVAKGGATLKGSAGPNVLTGSSADDTLDGGGGRDTLKGRGGNDTLTAADGGRDRVDGGRGDDGAVVDCGSDSVVKVEHLTC